jgi:hypothetical protein
LRRTKWAHGENKFSNARRLFPAFREPLPEKNQIARGLFAMRNRLPTPEQTLRRKRNRHAVQFARHQIQQGGKNSCAAITILWKVLLFQLENIEQPASSFEKSTKRRFNDLCQ